MLMIPPQSPVGALGVFLHALLVIFSAVGLTLHADFYAGIQRRDYWAYYTNQSNLLVFIYFTLLSPVLYTHRALRPLIPHAEYAVMLSIILTYAVFHFLLRPQIMRTPSLLRIFECTPIAHWDSVVQHNVVPGLCAAYWIFCSPGKDRLNPGDALIWLAFPLLFLIFAEIRARRRGMIHLTQSAYPYPFLDWPRFGLPCVLFVLASLLLLCVGFGFFGVLIAFKLPQPPGFSAFFFP